MKKKLSLVFGILMLVLLCIPSLKASATGYTVDLSTGETVDVLETHVITTGNDQDFEIVKSYGINVSSDTNEMVVPITLKKKGNLICTAFFTEDNPTTANGDFAIFADAACTQAIDYSTYYSSAVIPKAGTYYLKFTVLDSGEEIPEDGYYFAFVSQFLNGSDRTLANKAWTTTGTMDSSKPVYYKITATKAGSFTINVESEYSTNITLLNSSKKAISDETYYYSNDGKVCYAVEKGTYYLKVTSTSNYRIKSTFKAITDTSGSTKAKAKKLTAGKTLGGMLTATNKKGAVDWYKITLTKAQTVDITFTGNVSSGEIELEFYGNGISGSIMQSISTVDADKSFSAVTWTSDKLPKGTYYIKITKKTKNTSGFYNIKLNK